MGLIIRDTRLIFLSIDIAHIQCSMIELDLCAEFTIASLDKRLSEIDVLVADITTIDVMQVALSIVSTEKTITEET